MVLQFAVGGSIMPFITILLHDRGLDFTRISHVFFAASTTLLVFPFFWGMLADRFISLNRLFTVINLLAFAALVLLSFQHAFWGLLFCFAWYYACFNPTLTLINALSFYHLEHPREQFGFLRAWGSFGWILPSLPICLYLVGRGPANLTFTLYLAGLMALGIALVALFIPPTPPGTAKATIPGRPPQGYWKSLKLLLTHPNYVIILVSFFLMWGAFSIYMFYSPPYLEELGIDRAWIGPIQCIGVVCEIILFQFRAVLVNRLSYGKTILAGCLALTARHLLFAFSDSPGLLCASYVLGGMVIVFFTTGASLLVNAIAEVEVRSTAQTLLTIFGNGLGPMFANWAAGKLTAFNGNRLPPVFLFAASLAGLASLLIFLRGRRLEPGAGPSPIVLGPERADTQDSR